MGDVLAALIPPVVVAAVFCTFPVKLIRKEMAPRTSDGRLVSEVDTSTASGGGTASTATASHSEAHGTAAEDEDGAKAAQGCEPEFPGDGADRTDR